jgi:hypothetical protein
LTVAQAEGVRRFEKVKILGRLNLELDLNGRKRKN